MKKVEQQFLRFIDEKRLIGINDKILVGLSGGPDSVLLLHLLHKYSRRLRIKIGAVHVNHMLRGSKADSDEQFCRDLAEKLNIEFFSARKHVAEFAKENKLSVEEAGRKIRYGIFESYRKKFKYNKIATGHTCSDNAETVLLNLIKGAGLKGISGIPEKRGNIIRPVLVLTKQEILEYLGNQNIPFRIDETNLNTGYERNFIRHKIIPEIKKKMNPALEHTIFNSSELFRNYSRLAEDLIKKDYKRIVKFKNGALHFKIRELKALDNELQGGIFKSALERNFPQKFTFNDFRKFSSLLNKQTGKKELLSGHLSAVREREEILILNYYGKKKFEPAKIEEGGKIALEESLLTVGPYKASVRLSNDKNIEYISGDNLSGSFILRRWRQGDRFYPLGLKGSKKISDFLNEQKIPSYLKKNQLVLTNKNRIVWVLGLRLDDRFKIEKNTKKVLQLCLK